MFSSITSAVDGSSASSTEQEGRALGQAGRRLPAPFAEPGQGSAMAANTSISATRGSTRGGPAGGARKPQGIGVDRPQAVIGHRAGAYRQRNLRVAAQGSSASRPWAIHV